jgi:DNA-binding NarL/FixJ family response regulator
MIRTTGARPDGTKPRVLLVDDHRGILDRASAMLEDFDVVGMATDGRLAIEMASRVAPEVIVLDISMPGLDGFQTKRALEQAGSRAPVVFLSTLDADEYVNEAFRCGGHGYVLKPFLARDLPNALDQALHGRLFAPSLRSLHQVTGAAGHAMHLHSSEESYADSIASCFDLALHRGEATCLIGNEALRRRVATQLQARGWDADHAGSESRYRAVDTTTALSELLRDGLPDAVRLAAIVGELDEYRRTACAGSSSRLTIAGDLSATVCGAGNTVGGLAIERLWNTHTEGLPFLTVCGYPLSCFREHASGLWPMTAAEHGALCHGSEL